MKKDSWICGRQVNLYNLINTQICELYVIIIIDYHHSHHQSSSRSRLKADLTAIKTRMLASDLSFLCELHRLLHLLSLTHHSLSTFFPLPPFADLTGRIFGGEKTMVGKNVFIKWIRREIAILVTEGLFMADHGVCIILNIIIIIIIIIIIAYSLTG